MADETTELLIHARAYIERGWCRTFYAIDATGHNVAPSSEDAIAWCAWGALNAAAGRTVNSDEPAYRRLVIAMGGNGFDHFNITHFNDAQETVESVLAAFDRAIAARDR